VLIEYLVTSNERVKRKGFRVFLRNHQAFLRLIKG